MGDEFKSGNTFTIGSAAVGGSALLCCVLLVVYHCCERRRHDPPFEAAGVLDTEMDLQEKDAKGAALHSADDSNQKSSAHTEDADVGDHATGDSWTPTMHDVESPPARSVPRGRLVISGDQMVNIDHEKAEALDSSKKKGVKDSGQTPRVGRSQLSAREFNEPAFRTNRD